MRTTNLAVKPLAQAVSRETPKLSLASEISPDQLIAHIRQRCEDDFAFFVRYFFKARKGTKFVFNRHHYVICRDLMKLHAGEYEGYICNMPPRYGKTEVIVLMFPLWCYVRNRRCEFIHLSYGLPLALENSDAIRTVLKSHEFQQLWPGFKTRDTKDSKHAWATQEGGTFMAAQAGGSVTGFGAGRLDEWNRHTGEFKFSGCILIDDPLKPDDARHDAKRKAVNDRWQSTIKSRRNSPRTPVICVMQRIGEDDFTAELLADTDIKWKHRVLPALVNEDGPNECALWEDKHSVEVLKAMALTNRYVFDSQYQQRPVPRGGQFFGDWEKAQIVHAHPRMIKVIRYWDKAGTQGAGAYTAGVLMGWAEDGMYYILDVVRGQWSSVKREANIRQTAEIDGIYTHIWIEQEPGSGGKESAESTISKTLVGFSCFAERPTGDKVFRAEPLAVQVSAGNVRILKGDWNKEFLDEMKKFPGSKYKDQIDAASGAFNKLAVPTSMGILLKGGGAR